MLIKSPNRIEITWKIGRIMLNLFISTGGHDKRSIGITSLNLIDTFIMVIAGTAQIETSSCFCVGMIDYSIEVGVMRLFDCVLFEYYWLYGHTTNSLHIYIVDAVLGKLGVIIIIDILHILA